MVVHRQRRVRHTLLALEVSARGGRRWQMQQADEEQAGDKRPAAPGLGGVRSWSVAHEYKRHYGFTRGAVVKRCKRSSIVSLLEGVGSCSVLGNGTTRLQGDLHSIAPDDPTHRVTGDRARRAGHLPQD
jgi:hypothetical protein